MGLPAKLLRSQLAFFKPFVSVCSLDIIRRGQDKLGELMEVLHKKDVIVRDHSFPLFQGAWVIPRDERRQGVLLYLHGGGYTCGDLNYAKGFGSTLAAVCGTRVFCAAYRLAPEAPFPAALDDAVEAYRYLLSKGYAGRQISLCGESAGGGLEYALCLRLKELSLPLPCGIIAISPWTDLTVSGRSCETNRENDPSLTEEVLRFYADCYAGEQDKTLPLLSPLFGDLRGLPPSLIFAGGDEILLDDARRLHEKLVAGSCISQLHVAPERWHAYVLYQLNENEDDFDRINAFLTRVLSPERKLRWMRLDNAAKIYPAARRRDWNNFFRVSATLTEAVDTAVLQSALDVTARRFPSMAVRLRRGLFWYYLEELDRAPPIQAEKSCPLAHVPFREVRRCAFRVLVYDRRIAVEFFHALTDGTGAIIFLKTLLAEYLTQKTGVTVSAGHGVLGRLEEPSEEELEDSFLKYAGPVSASRSGAAAFRIPGTPELDGYNTLTTLMLDAGQLLGTAHAHQATVTEFLCAVMIRAILDIQAERISHRQLRRPVNVLLPVNLRSLYPSRTLRNFSLFVTPGVDPRLGDYSFQELCRLVHFRLGLDVTAKQMGTQIAVNVSSEKILFLKLMPLFIKNFAMKAVFDVVGERNSCLCLSNMGRLTLPESMRPYVSRMDFIIGVQAKAPHNCSIVTYGDTTYINFIRNSRESTLELHFFRVLQSLGLTVTAESNQR